MSPTTRCWACNMGWFDSPELDCSCFERDSHWEMSRFSSLSPLPHYSIRPMGVDVPDDFAGKKMKGTATVSK